MVARFGYMVNKWTVTAVAALALMAVVLATALPVGAQTSGKCEEIGEMLSCTYVEHSSGRVYDFHANPSGGSGVVAWSLVEDAEDHEDHADYPDEGKFRIDPKSGVLTFKSPPDFEDAKGTADSNDMNIYKVMVKAEVDTMAGKNESTQGVTVTVTNKEEDGAVTLDNLQPQVRVTITATLDDPDEDHKPSESWQWSRSSSRSGGYTSIAEATEDSYRPGNDDVGKYLRATVKYSDGHGEGVDTAMASSMYLVRAQPDEDNTAPMFPEESLDNDNDVDTTDRMIDENTPAGMNVGPPVVATDDNLDMLTYILGGIDAGLFSIDQATGQVMTKAKLNHEDSGGDERDVTVMAKDPFGTTAGPVTVSITVNDLNEAPKVSGTAFIEHPEDNSTLDTDLGELGGQAAEYTASDDDAAGSGNGLLAAEAGLWELEGPDASKFTITEATPGVLSFKDAPNFEDPGDANKDNVYQVTVVARDIKWATGTKDVTIKVTNVKETGTVTLSHIQPEVAETLRATLSDPDGGETGVIWQWYWTNTTDDANKIDGATSSSYTPRAIGPGDGTTAAPLGVKATYTDNKKEKDDRTTGDVDESMQTAMVTSSTGVRASQSSNDRPYFENDGDTTDPPTKVTTYTRYIPENQDVGTPLRLEMDSTGDTDADVTATDVANADDTTDIAFLQYELGGADKAYFEFADPIVQTAVVIQTAKKLNYESKKRHTVTVKATDPSGGYNTVTVNIMVVDVDEAPKITGPKRIEYMENGTAAVGSITAQDQDRKKAINWTNTETGETDDLKLTTKQGSRATLVFKSPPDFEDPKGGASDDNNIHVVTLQATVAGAAPCTVGDAEVDCVAHEVSVMVTDVAEAPDFKKPTDTLSVMENEPVNTDVDAPVTADDGDGDMRTYTLSGRDAKTFSIIPATGQIKTRMKLDYETKNSYSVVVTATDPTDRKDTINITISVEDVAEVPDITQGGLTVSGPSSESYVENGMGAIGTYEAQGPKAASARWSLEGEDARDFRIEGSGASVMLKFKNSPNYEMPMDADEDNVYMVTVKATDGANMDTQDVTVTVTNVSELGMLGGMESIYHAENDRSAVGTYTVDGEMADDATWSLGGDDRGDFSISGGMLRFKTAPDYEMPMDANTDNTYEVMVKAEVGGEMAEKSVTVMVTNVDEDGMVTLSPMTPVVGRELTATLADPDMVVEDSVTWEWSRSMTMDENTFTYITDADEAEYTPKAEDVGYYLMATATYDDGESSIKEATATTTSKVVANAAPMFAAETATLMVAENSAAGSNVGAPVTATGANGDTLSYALSGDDAMYLTINSGTGQIMVGGTAMLDYESAKMSYMVTVTATDPDDEMASIEVTIMVTDVNELGMLTGMASVDYPENGTAAVDAYMVDGTMAASAVWSLEEGGDAERFMLEGSPGASVMLKFMESPDYEMPRGMAMSDTNTNTYMVTVKVEAGGEMQMQEVTIMVTDVNELGMLTGMASVDYPENGTAAVDAYMVDGTMAASAVWSLEEGGDAERFMLEGSPGASVMLKFMESPDYEMPRGMAMSDTNTNTYMVTVKVEAGGEMQMQEVTINVTDVNEDERDPVVARYDANNNGTIEKSEVITAINDYLFGTGDDAPSKAEVIELINLYLFG